MKRPGSSLVGVAASIAMTLFAVPSSAIAQPASVPQQIAALQARMTDAESRLTSTESRLTSAESRLTSTESRLTAAEALGTVLTAENASQAAQIAVLQAGMLPVGTIISYSAETPPEGYLECDGSAVLRADYPDLFAVIGTAFGDGDGSSTFRVPDLRGLFLRGWSHSTPNWFDPDRASRTTLYPGGASGDRVGSYQQSQVQHHAHPVFTAGHDLLGSFRAIIGGNAFGSIEASTGGVYGGSSETRPRNVSVMYAIKY